MRERKLRIAEFIETLATPQEEVVVFGGTHASTLRNIINRVD